MIRKWIGTTRFVYNKCLDAVKRGTEKMDFQSLRNRFVTKKGNTDINDWEFETPKDIRAGAIKDLQIAYKSAMSNLRNGNIHHFKLGFRKKKEDKTIRIPHTAIKKEDKKITIYNSYMKSSIRVSNDKSFKSCSIDYDCRVGIEYGKWYIYIPMTTPTVKTSSKKEICALDPGIVNFHTIYSEHESIKIQINRDQMKKIREKIDYLQSLRAKKKIKSQTYKKKEFVLRRLQKNKIDDLHFQTINFLTKNYKTILIPTFESQDIVRKMISKNNKRELLSLQHFKFKERLKSKASIIKGCIVKDVTEEYTSKTCSSCGKINEIGYSRILKCKNCNVKIDRDVNGSRCIMIKVLKENL